MIQDLKPRRYEGNPADCDRLLIIPVEDHEIRLVEWIAERISEWIASWAVMPFDGTVFAPYVSSATAILDVQYEAVFRALIDSVFIGTSDGGS